MSMSNMPFKVTGMGTDGRYDYFRSDYNWVRMPPMFFDDEVKALEYLEGLEIGDSIHISHTEIAEGVDPTIKDRDFTYSNKSTSMLNKLIAQVKKDSLYEDLKVDLESALLKSKPSKELDLLTYKNEIVEFLENEIVSRYYFRKGKVINSFKYDEVVKEAISLFKDMQKFNEILGE